MISVVLLAMAACSKNDSVLSNDSSNSIQSFTASEQDSMALVALYKSTQGEQWPWGYANWESEPLHRWYGVEMEKINGVRRVTSLTLTGMNLKGELPAAIGDLTELREIRLNFNPELTGEIPSEFFQLRNLVVVDFSYTGITGELSEEVGNLVKLDTLKLRKGYGVKELLLSGEIPASLSKLKVLRWLDLDNNAFTGEIPAAIGEMTSLESFGVWMNRLTGEIPAVLGNLTNLKYMCLAGNEFSGAIPSELGKLKNLLELSMDGNNLSGEIPAALGEMTSLGYLDMGHNNLTGKLPAELVKLYRLGIFRANDNALEGEIPQGLCNENPYLVSVCLQNNNLTGEIPNLHGFQIGTVIQPWYCQLVLHGNRFSGDIPAWLVQFPSDCRKNLFPQQSGYGFSNEGLVQ